MKIHMTGNKAFLEGDCTLSGMTQNTIDSMAVALQKIEPGGVKELHIDCRNVSSIDTNGLHLLNVWAQCASFRGVKTGLIISNNKLQQSFQSLGLPCRFSSLISEG